ITSPEGIGTPGFIPSGTFIQSFGTGTGGMGTYNLNQTTVTGAITSGVLTVTTVGNGALYVGDQITGAGIPDGTSIQCFVDTTAQIPCDPGNTWTPRGLGDYHVNQTTLTGVPFETITTTLTVPSEPITAATPYGAFAERWPTRREMLAAGRRV